MKNKITPSICALLLLSITLLGQSKYDKSLMKAEAAFKIGDYRGAKSILAKAKKKIVAKMGAQNQYTPTLYLMQAKYDLGLGMPFDFESDLQSALKANIALNSETSEKYAVMLIDAGELYNQSGSYRLAREYLSNARKLLDVGTFNKDALNPRWDIIMAETLTGQGYWNEAMTLLRGREVYYAMRAVKQETIAD